MNEFLKIFILAIIAALIGWTTNVLAIKLLFRPFDTVNILGFKIQGLIPKRRKEIAKSIGEIIETELVSTTEIVENLLTDENINEFKNVFKNRIKELIVEKVPSFILGSFQDKIELYVDNLIDGEDGSLMEEFIDRINNKAETEIKLSSIIEGKVNSFELERLEKIVLTIASREFKHIEVLGGILGFIIGIVQGVIITLI